MSIGVRNAIFALIFVGVVALLQRPTAPIESFQVEKNSKILLDLETALSLGIMTEKHVISEGGCMGGYLKPIPAIDLEDLSIQYDETKEAVVWLRGRVPLTMRSQQKWFGNKTTTVFAKPADSRYVYAAIVPLVYVLGSESIYCNTE